MPFRRWLTAAILVLLASPCATAQEKGRKVAFLVGVGSFRHDLPDLKGSPQKDVAELGRVLRAGGFEVVSLSDKAATRDGIEAGFRAAVGAGPTALGKGDVLLVALCTHGFNLPPAAGKPVEPFVAGYDAKPGDPATMVALNRLIDAPRGSGAACLFLVDACREEADPNRGIAPTRATLPKGTAVLFACAQGELSHQSEKAGGHGLFTYAVLKTLRPAAGGRVSWSQVVTGVEQAFQSDELRALIPAGRRQTPVLATGELGYTELLVAPARAEKPAKPGRVVTGFVTRSFRNADGTTSPYEVFVPHDYTGETAYPVVLFLHGAGESRGGPKRPSEVGLGAAVRAREREFGAVVVFPQSEKRTWAADSDDGKRALRILDEVLKEYNVDPGRQYLTGLSLGAFGTWALAAAHPRRWAAIAPVAGGGQPEAAALLRGTPCWCFHGQADVVVKPEQARAMVDALKKAGGSPRYTEYPNVGHNCWDLAYAEKGFFPWLLAQKK